VLLRSARARFLVGALALPLAAFTINATEASAEVTPRSGGTALTAKAGRPTSPGRFTGLGFDTCQAPGQATMNELRRESPFWGVGIYIGGSERSCSQPNLTPRWVRTQRASGWQLFPVWVGRQSACAKRSFHSEISSSNAVARKQGAVSARRAATVARGMGLARGSTLFLDIEDYDNLRSVCNQPVFNYMSGWNKTLKRLGWKGGLYAAGASGIAVLDLVKHDSPDAYIWPTSVWIAHADGRATTRSAYLRNSYYPRQRVKQYAIDTTRTYGSVTLKLDMNVIDIGGGAVVPPPRPSCGVRLSFPSYRVLHSGSRGAQVGAAQCLLKRTGDYGGKVTGRFNKRTAVAVGRFQSGIGVRPSRKVGKGTWAALNSAGSVPLLKRGSASDRVRGLQRALTAALDRQVLATGYFNPATTRAVRRYQANVGLAADGIVDMSTWRALKSAKR
jgi:hypothetical protein